MKRLVALFVVLLCLVGAFLFVTRPKSALSRLNILMGTSPVSVWSWDKRDGTFTVIQLPAEVAADAPGYGRYSLEALWKLGFIDHKGGRVLAQSLTNTLALPTSWFMGDAGNELVQTGDPVAYGRRVFSPGGIVPYLLRRRVTNIPITHYVSFMWVLSRARSDAVDLVDLVARRPTAQETLPDGTTREFFDSEQVDELLKGRFEDEAIRRENIAVAVYNTTATPALGTYAARLLISQGILVVAVGNSEPEVAACVLEGTDSTLQTKTARVAAELFGCKKEATGSGERADLVVRVGSAVALRHTEGN